MVSYFLFKMKNAKCIFEIVQNAKWIFNNTKNYIKNIYYSLRVCSFALSSNCFSNITSPIDLLFGHKIMPA